MALEGFVPGERPMPQTLVATLAVQPAVQSHASTLCPDPWTVRERERHAHLQTVRRTSSLASIRTERPCLLNHCETKDQDRPSTMRSCLVQDQKQAKVMFSTCFSAFHRFSPVFAGLHTNPSYLHIFKYFTVWDGLCKVSSSAAYS